MPIQFTCTHCKQPLKTSDESAGKNLACPKCKSNIIVPTTQATPAPAKRTLSKKKPTIPTWGWCLIGSGILVPIVIVAVILFSSEDKNKNKTVAKDSKNQSAKSKKKKGSSKREGSKFETKIKKPENKVPTDKPLEKKEEIDFSNVSFDLYGMRIPKRPSVNKVVRVLEPGETVNPIYFLNDIEFSEFYPARHFKTKKYIGLTDEEGKKVTPFNKEVVPLKIGDQKIADAYAAELKDKTNNSYVLYVDKSGNFLAFKKGKIGSDKQFLSNVYDWKNNRIIVTYLDKTGFHTDSSNPKPDTSFSIISQPAVANMKTRKVIGYLKSDNTIGPISTEKLENVIPEELNKSYYKGYIANIKSSTGESIVIFTTIGTLFVVGVVKSSK